MIAIKNGIKQCDEKGLHEFVCTRKRGTRLNSKGEARQTRGGRNWGAMNFKAMKNE